MICFSVHFVENVVKSHIDILFLVHFEENYFNTEVCLWREGKEEGHLA